jgi:predicted metal-dependent phosphoesterase TrpH
MRSGNINEHANTLASLGIDEETAGQLSIIRQPRLGLADVHMHTNYSDGTGSVEEVLHFAQHATPLDVIAITDHDTIEGALRARDLAASGKYRFQVIVGEEISTREGHMLALFLQKSVPPDLSIERSIELVHEQGGLAVIAHPFNRVFRHSVQRSVMNRLLRQPELHPDGIETLNGSFAGIGSSRIAMALARSVYHWAETGGSDAHTTTAIGCARTLFPGRTAQDLRQAILECQTAPEGSYWQAREYVAFVSHRVVYGGGATHEGNQLSRKRVGRIRGAAQNMQTRRRERRAATLAG